MVNRVVGYLDKEFKSYAGTEQLSSDKKKTISRKIDGDLKKIISPLKWQSLKDINSESLKLVDDLNIDKLVSRTARESEDLTQGVIGKIKKFCRRVLDSISIFTSKEKEILKAFKDNVKKGSVENPTKMRSGKGLQI